MNYNPINEIILKENKIKDKVKHKFIQNKQMSQNYEQWKLEQMQLKYNKKQRNKNSDSEGYFSKAENGIGYKKNYNSYLDECVENYHKERKSDYEINWRNTKKDREPNGELQVVLNGNIVMILKQQMKTNQQRQNRKYSDQESYAMSNNISGPKFSDIPCPQFLSIRLLSYQKISKYFILHFNQLDDHRISIRLGRKSQKFKE